MVREYCNSVQLNRYLLQKAFKPGCIGIDATAGNGNDTLFLARNCARVYSFDIQQVAIDSTAELLRKNEVQNVELIHDSFVNMESHVREPVDIIMFNLGYLPKGDKNITTMTEDTLVAIKSALNLINESGVVSIIIYWGHEEGKRERKAILEYVNTLDEHQFHVLYASMPNQSNSSPEVLLISRR